MRLSDRTLIRLFFCLGLGVMQGTANAAEKKALPVPFRTEGVSRAEESLGADGTWIGRTVQTRFDFVPASAWADPSAHLLLRSTFTREERSDREGAVSRLEVVAKKSGSKPYAKPYATPAWRLTAPADEIVFPLWGDFLETVRHGCCGAEDLHGLVDLETGRRIAAFSEHAAFLTADDRVLDRVVSYLSMMASREGVTFPDDANAIGVLSLAGRAGTSSRILLTRSPIEDTGTPKILVRGPADEEAFDVARLPEAKKGRAAAAVVNAVTVTLDWGNGVAATIPIVGDAFDLSSATLPKGMSARPAR